MNWQQGIRLSVFLIFTAFMTAGPFYSQVLGGNGLLFRSWTMFSAYGLGTIDARFTHLREDGTEVVLNRYDLLKETYQKQKRGWRREWFYYDWPKWNSGPRNFWSIQAGESSVVNARRLCAVVGSGSIRIDSRIATRRGWVPASKGEVIECDGQGVTE